MSSGPPKGNQFWKMRSSHGANPKFKEPEPLWEACQEYFQWVDDHPMKEGKTFAYQGGVTNYTVPKMRAMTLEGLCIYLDIDRSTWSNWRKNRHDLSRVIRKTEEIIREQKFTGAAAGMLNPSIIARDLSLVDVTNQQVSGLDGGPIEVAPSDKLMGFIDGIAERRGKTS